MNNRIQQKKYDHYKNTNEIIEMLHEIKSHVPPCVYKVLSYFKTTPHGSTQASIKKICQDAKISTSTWDKTVKIFLETEFAIPILKIEEGPRKLDHSRTRKVRGCQYKYLQPFHLIKKAIEKKIIENQEEEKREALRIQEEIRRDEILLFGESVIKSENTFKEKSPSPCESKDESDFSNEHIKSFNNKSFKKSFKELNIIKIKSEIQSYLNTFPLFRDFSSWTEKKRYEIAKTLQLAIIKTRADIEEVKVQFMIKSAITKLNEKHSEKPLNEFLPLLYTYVSNGLKTSQGDDSEHSEDDAESRSKKYDSFLDDLFKRGQHEDEKGISRQELDDLGIW